MKEVKRIVSTSFWNDDKVLNEFSPEDKYFMLYLLTNPYTTQLGVYHLPLKKVALELGYSLDAVLVLLERFENKYGIIKYNSETSEVAIKNFLRYSIVKGGKPVMDCLLKDEKSIKDKSLIDYVCSHLSNVGEDNLIPTVNTYIEEHKYLNDNDNDNDNERNVHVTSTLRHSEQKNNEIEVLINSFEFEKELRDSVSDWIAYKKEKKQSYQPKGLEILLKKIKKESETYGSEAIVSAIEYSMSNSYQGIVWDKLKNAKPTYQYQSRNNSDNAFDFLKKG